MAVSKALRKRRGWRIAADPNDSRRQVLASPSVGHFRGTPVYLWVTDKSLEPKMIDADLHDDLAKGSKNSELFELEICCPRCGAWNRIPGDKKRFDVGYLDTPRILRHPHDGEPVQQVAVVNIEDVCECSEPIGKTKCGYRFRIQDNRIVTV